MIRVLSALFVPAVALVALAAPAQAARPTHVEYTMFYIEPSPAGTLTQICTTGKVLGGTAYVMQPGIGSVTAITVDKGTGKNPGSVTATYSTTSEGNIEFAVTCTGAA